MTTAQGLRRIMAMQIFDDMQARGILADVVTCCSLINALERGGQWQLAEQLFVQMCAASWQRQGTSSPLYRMMEIAAAAAVEDAGPSQGSEGPSRHAIAPASQGWGSPEHHSNIALSPQTVKCPLTPQQRLAQPPQEASPVQYSRSSSLQTELQGAMGSASSPLLRTPPVRHVSDLQHQFSNLSDNHNDRLLQASLSTPDVTNFYTSQSSSSFSNGPSFPDSLYQHHGALSASSSRLRGSAASLSSLQSQASPLKFAPTTPEKPLQQHASGDYASLTQDFAGMHMQPSRPCSLTMPQQSTSIPLSSLISDHRTESSLFSHATAKHIQEAAAHRQDTLSLSPTTNPVGHGQAPVLRFMNVTQIAPNRVCCNALLAAYARAKPTQWQKVSSSSTKSDMLLQTNILHKPACCIVHAACKDSDDNAHAWPAQQSFYHVAQAHSHMCQHTGGDLVCSYAHTLLLVSIRCITQCATCDGCLILC